MDAKEKNVPAEGTRQGRGDVWTWTAIDAETKLVPCWYVGNRDAGAAYHFMHDLAGRLANRVQLTTDGTRPYLSAVEDAFGTEIDYAQLVKIYGSPETSKYNAGGSLLSRRQCMGARKAKIIGKPDYAHVSTSICERNNLTHADGNAPVYPPDQCLFKEGREPGARRCPSFHELQFLPHSRQLARYSRDGSGRCGSCLELGGSHCSVRLGRNVPKGKGRNWSDWRRG